MMNPREAAEEFARANPLRGSAVDLMADTNDRLVRYVFSDPSVARDNHTIATDAWRLDNFRANPVFLWAHDSSAPPIGKVVEIGTTSGRLLGAVRYATAEDYPFADMIYRLVRGGFLNAVSVGWLPLDWKRSGDKDRPLGLDFVDVDLLEISQVPVPAAPGALVTAREMGIDTAPLYCWAERVLDEGCIGKDLHDPVGLILKETRMAKKSVPADPAPEPAPVAPSSPEPATLTDAFENLYKSDQMRAWLAEGYGLFLERAKAMAGEESKGSVDPASPAAIEQAVARVLEAHGVVRAGKAISAGNEQRLREALEHHAEVARCIREVLKKSEPDDGADKEPDDDDDDAEGRDAHAARLRRAKALALKAVAF